MAYFTSQKIEDRLLIFHKETNIIEYTVKGDKVISKVHNKNSIFHDHLHIYETYPIIAIMKEGKKYFIAEYKNMEMLEEVITKTELKKRLKQRGMNKNQIEAVFVDLDNL